MARRSRMAPVLFAWLCALGLACAGLDTARQRSVENLLRERAAHLDDTARRRIARALLLAEARHGVDALLLVAVAERESQFRPRATSPRGARGLLQIRPATARDVARRNGLPWRGADDLYEAARNIQIGAAYLAELETSLGSWELALAAYHRGPAKIRRTLARGRPVRSAYATRVMSRYRELQRL